MSSILSVYHEIRTTAGWAFAGDMELTDPYGVDLEDFEPYPRNLYTGYSSELWSLLGIAHHRFLLPPQPTFPYHGYPPDLSPLLQRDARERIVTTITIRALAAWDWSAPITFTMAWSEPLLPGMTVVEDPPRLRAFRERRSHFGRGETTVRAVEWRKSCAQAAGAEFMDAVVEQLTQRYGATDDVRIVCILSS